MNLTRSWGTLGRAIVLSVVLAGAARGAEPDVAGWPRQLEALLGRSLGDSDRTRVADAAGDHARKARAIGDRLAERFWQTTGMLPAELEALRASIKRPDPVGLALIHGVEAKAGRFLSERERTQLLAAVNEAERSARELAAAAAASMATAVPGLTAREKGNVHRAWIKFVSTADPAALAGGDRERVSGRIMSVDLKTGNVTIKPPAANAQPVVVTSAPGTKLRVLGRRGVLAGVKSGMMAAAVYDAGTKQAVSLDVKPALRKPPSDKGPAAPPVNPRPAPRRPS